MNTKFWLENLDRGDHLEDLDIDGRIILRWVLRRQDVRGNTAGAIPCAHHNESSDSR
jgi:hypothetical protein